MKFQQTEDSLITAIEKSLYTANIQIQRFFNLGFSVDELKNNALIKTRLKNLQDINEIILSEQNATATATKTKTK